MWSPKTEEAVPKPGQKGSLVSNEERNHALNTEQGLVPFTKNPFDVGSSRGVYKKPFYEKEYWGSHRGKAHGQQWERGRLANTSKLRRGGRLGVKPPAKSTLVTTGGGWGGELKKILEKGHLPVFWGGTMSKSFEGWQFGIEKIVQKNNPLQHQSTTPLN